MRLMRSTQPGAGCTNLGDSPEQRGAKSRDKAAATQGPYGPATESAVVSRVEMSLSQSTSRCASTSRALHDLVQVQAEVLWQIAQESPSSSL